MNQPLYYSVVSFMEKHVKRFHYLFEPLLELMKKKSKSTIVSTIAAYIAHMRNSSSSLRSLIVSTIEVVDYVDSIEDAVAFVFADVAIVANAV